MQAGIQRVEEQLIVIDPYHSRYKKGMLFGIKRLKCLNSILSQHSNLLPKTVFHLKGYTTVAVGYMYM